MIEVPAAERAHSRVGLGDQHIVHHQPALASSPTHYPHRRDYELAGRPPTAAQEAGQGIVRHLAQGLTDGGGTDRAASDQACDLDTEHSEQGWGHAGEQGPQHGYVHHQQADDRQTAIVTPRILCAKVRGLHRAVSLWLPDGAAVREVVIRTRILPFLVGLTQRPITLFAFLRKSCYLVDVLGAWPIGEETFFIPGPPC